MSPVKMPAKKKKNYRAYLPAGRCAFCKNETDNKVTCDYTGFECFATCTTCRGMGAPLIHAPSKMITVYSMEGKKRVKKKMRYPQAARKYAFKCRHCGVWHDKTMLHEQSRQDGNYGQSVCTKCYEAHEITVCQSCHGVCSINPSCKDTKGYLCENCFSRNCQFESLDKGSKMKIITKSPLADRTFGLELEINQVHMAQVLVDEIDKLNFKGIEFDVKRDGSIHHGFEIVSFPAELSILMGGLKEMFKVVRQYRHNYENAGIHVHVCEKKIDPVKLLKVWGAVEDFHYSFLPKFRHDNQYSRPVMKQNITWCGRNSGNTIDNVLNVSSEEEARQRVGGRKALNLSALDKYGTIEFRGHHASTDYREVSHFLRFLDCLFDRALEPIDKAQLKAVYKHSLKCRSYGEDSHFRAVAKFLQLDKNATEFLLSRKHYYDNNDHNHKTLGVLTRYRFNNARTPEEIRERSAGRRYAFVSESAIATDTYRPPRQRNAHDFGGNMLRLSNDSDRRVVEYTLSPAIDHAITSPGKIYIDDHHNNFYMVSDGNYIWAYQHIREARAKSDEIRQRTLDYISVLASRSMRREYIESMLSRANYSSESDIPNQDSVMASYVERLRSLC